MIRYVGINGVNGLACENLIAQFYFSLLSETHRGRQTHSFGVGNHEKGKAREGVWGSRENQQVL